jgi:hypothetical protein
MRIRSDIERQNIEPTRNQEKTDNDRTDDVRSTSLGGP